jgi:hypothetical protein
VNARDAKFVSADPAIAGGGSPPSAMVAVEGGRVFTPCPVIPEGWNARGATPDAEVVPGREPHIRQKTAIMPKVFISCAERTPERVLAPGLVHEYLGGDRRDLPVHLRHAGAWTEHVQAQVACLRRFAPGLADRYAAKLSVTERAYRSRDLQEIVNGIGEALRECAPDGLYWGAPNPGSRMVGFWPMGGCADDDARKMGACRISRE